MLEHLNNEFNETRTANGAFAYKSTKSAVLDLFSQGGAMRQRSDNDVIQLVSKAFAENPLLTLKTLFYLRDIRFGQGERRLFRLTMKHIALHNPEALKKNLHLVSEFGRWDDLWVLLETRLKDDVLNLVGKQLIQDKKADNPSLLGKWLPSENASSYQTKKYAKVIRNHFNATPKQYRQLLSKLRKRISLVETKLTEKNYSEIDYSKIPSRAGMIYRGAFFRNDLERYQEFLDSLSKGEVKVNAGALYPNDIVGKILDTRYGWRQPQLSQQEIQLFEGQWNNLPDFIGENKEESIVMADVSGSMSGTPMNVAISLAMYIAERNKGTYKDHFMTFSANPQLVKIQGSDIVEKVYNISRADWGMNTNVEKALLKLLDVAVKNSLPKEEMVKKVYIVSDMQWDSAVRGSNVNIFKNAERLFNQYGYEFPSITFWNVNASSNTPMTMNESGVQLVSGFSPSIMTQLLNADGKTPYEFMLDVIESDRYAEVTV